MPRSVEVDCCIAGGGPAGMMAGLLLARAGCRTLVLEKHADFLRDFRGDTVHPSTMEIMRELGLLEAFLARPHQRLARLSGVFAGQEITVADFSTLPVSAKFIAFMPQWHFLDFLADAARSLPTFALEMRTQAMELLRDNGRIAGVRAEGPEGTLEVRATLTIGADGRGSALRSQAGLAVTDIGAPIDVLWFRLPRNGVGGGDEPLLNTGPGHILITIDRGDYYQCAFVIPKGAAEAVRAAGLDAFRRVVGETAPRLGGPVQSLSDLDELKLLTVKVDRLDRWSQPGLLMIGDAAHAMSPIGGVGINLAIQDAVAAANLLAGPIADGSPVDDLLERVEKRRAWPTRATQFIQVQAQSRIIAPLLSGKRGAGPPLPLEVISRLPWLQRRAAALIGLGVRPEHVASPERHHITPPPLEQVCGDEDSDSDPA